MKKYSAKHIAAIIILLLGTIHLITISLFSFVMLRQNIQAKYYDRAKILLEYVIDSANEQLHSAEIVVKYISEMDEVRGNYQQEKARELLVNFKHLLTKADSIVFSDASGRCVSTSPINFSDYYDPYKQPWYEIAATADGSAAAPFWTEPFLNYEDQHIVFAVSADVRTDGVFSGVVSAVYDVSSLSSDFRYDNLGSNDLMMLLSCTGTVIASRGNYFIGDELFTEHLPCESHDVNIVSFNDTLKGREYSVYAGRIPGSGMYLAAAVDIAEVNREFRSRFTMVFLIELLILFLYSIGTYMLAHRGIMPLDKLSELMAEAEKGNYYISADFSYYREIDLLSKQFNSMLDGIRSRDEILRHREVEIKNLAYYDSLTGLPNRTYLLEKLEELMEEIEEEEFAGALLYLDLDGFKLINDTMGHSTGDLVLKAVALRLKHNLRYRQLAARIGGDEFIILLQDVESIGIARKVANRLLDVLNEPIEIEHTRYDIGASIGIVIYPLHGESSDVLLRKADMAMYKAKRSGKNNFQMFEENLEDEILRRNTLEKGIRRAVKEKLLFFCYQPVYNVRDGKILGFEALLRHRTEELSLFNTSEIIIAAEETGMITDIEDQVFPEGFRFINELNSRYESDLMLSVNVSSQHMMQSHFIENINRLINDSGAEVSSIDFEITETVMMESIKAGRDRLRELKDVGVSISMDDFGTGYSSLSYLQNFPIDRVKIDRSFIEEMEKDEKKRNIIGLIIEMARNLDIEAVAEGVENENQLKYLKKFNCMAVQGFYLSKPMPAEEIRRLCDRQFFRI